MTGGVTTASGEEPIHMRDGNSAPYRMSKDQEVLLSMLLNVNGNDRRKPVRDFEESASKAHQLAAITFLGAFFQ
jgi:hypothetical protein